MYIHAIAIAIAKIAMLLLRTLSSFISTRTVLQYSIVYALYLLSKTEVSANGLWQCARMLREVLLSFCLLGFSCSYHIGGRRR